MNRQQRRKEQKEPEKIVESTGKAIPICKAVHLKPDFSRVPLVTMCQSIQLLINELYKRGYPIYDFDHKAKYVQGIQIIQGKVYFLVAEGESDHEKV